KSGMKDGMKVLAALTITVALILATLAVYLCLTRRRHGSNGKGDYIILYVTLIVCIHYLLQIIFFFQKYRTPAFKIEGDPEVPYADIVISVRGASTPDISQALYLNSTDRNE
ncbi:hypothetical protein NL108_014444, partial [Boleophthalmus pectinirostris]